jgi:hypothetical protein
MVASWAVAWGMSFKEIVTVSMDIVSMKMIVCRCLSARLFDILVLFFLVGVIEMYIKTFRD